MAAVSALGNAALPPYGGRLEKALTALHAVNAVAASCSIMDFNGILL